GVYRSGDGGITWARVLAHNSSVELTVSFDSLTGETAYASALGFFNGDISTGIYKSTDTGQTWALASGAGNNSLPTAGILRTDLSVAPSNSNVVYAAPQKSNQLLGFYKTVDGGATWTRIAAPAGEETTWGWSFRVHPTNPDIIYAGGAWIYRSLDGGMTWVNMSTGAGGEIPAQWQHVQAFSKDGSVLYIGTEEGVWNSTAPLNSPVVWKNLNRTLSTALLWPGLSIHPTDSSIGYAGAFSGEP